MNGSPIEAVLLEPDAQTQNRYIKLSQELLLAIKTNGETRELVKKLADAPLQSLQTELNHDNKRKAFWINIYNAFSQYLLQKRGKTWFPKLANQLLFNSRQIEIAGEYISLNIIEHHLLRRSKIWWSRGYLKRWFPTGFEKKLRVDRLDNRIHFALNCGAQSCPPIRFYDPGKIDDQLDIATAAYLEQEVDVHAERRELKTPRIFSWFLNDFEGKNGVLNLLKRFNIISDKELTYRLRFKKFSQNTHLKNFS